MERRSVSPVAAGIIVIALLGIAAATYYFALAAPAAQITSTTAQMSSASSSTSSTALTTTTSSSSARSSAQSSTSSTNRSTGSMSSSSSQSSSTTTTSSGPKSSLHILAVHLSHTLAGNALTGRCSSAVPAQGASYLQVTNNGTAPAEITRIDISYVEMMTSSGSPTGSCVVAVGATEYITMTGVGADPASSGTIFSLFLVTTDGEYANVGGTFG